MAFRASSRVRDGDADRVAGTPAPPADAESVARAICLQLLDRAPRTRGELEVAMRRKLVPDDAATRVLDRLEEVGLIDDAAFATAWVGSRHGTRGLSGRALARELRSRGVADETVDAAVAELDDETELDTARELVRKRLRSMSGVPVAAQQRRLVALLGRKGYGGGVAFQVVREVLQAPDGDHLHDLGDVEEG